MTNDLISLSLEELSKLLGSAQNALQERQKEHRKSVIQKIHALADSIGVTVTLGDEPKGMRKRSSKGSKAPIRYRNPNDASQTWSGRGLKPKWLQAFIQAGQPLDAFKV
jgi:DNA-binding protein H-NS